MNWIRILVGLVFALVVAVACNAGLWWVAHQMAWWTYALMTTGTMFFWVFVKVFVKELMK